VAREGGSQVDQRVALPIGFARAGRSRSVASSPPGRQLILEKVETKVETKVEGKEASLAIGNAQNVGPRYSPPRALASSVEPLNLAAAAVVGVGWFDPEIGHVQIAVPTSSPPKIHVSSVGHANPVEEVEEVEVVTVLVTVLVAAAVAALDLATVLEAVIGLVTAVAAEELAGGQQSGMLAPITGLEILRT